MLHNLFVWLGVVEHKSFERITSGLTKMVDDLHTLAAHHGLQTVVKNTAIEELTAQVENHTFEAEKAISAATKIGGLLA